MFGGWLGATGRVDFGRLDRTPSSIPSAGAGSTARPEGSIAKLQWGSINQEMTELATELATPPESATG